VSVEPQPQLDSTPKTARRARVLARVSGLGEAGWKHRPTQFRGTTRQETTVAIETTAKITPHQRAVHELKELAIIFVYLYITFGAVIVMKTAVLHDEGISFAPWGIAAVKAALLAKFILIGRAMKLGERFTARPLIWPTLHKALAFLVLLVVLVIIEEVVVGLFHHQSVAASLGELFGARLYETLAGILIVLLVLIPYFAFHVLDEALGEGTLARIFFVERSPMPISPSATTRR
jgi:hypothetical protein